MLTNEGTLTILIVGAVAFILFVVLPYENKRYRLIMDEKKRREEVSRELKFIIEGNDDPARYFLG